MDDIIEKLSLLDYENTFCKGWKHKRISRIYYAHSPHQGEDVNERCNVMYDMCYWLMSMNKEKVSSFHVSDTFQSVSCKFKFFGGSFQFDYDLCVYI